jgi:hypothetical protein
MAVPPDRAPVPDSPLFLGWDRYGQATVWVEAQELVSPQPSIYYRQDRAPADALPVTFQLFADVVDELAAGHLERPRQRPNAL